ncbi:beta-1,6-N-acetylglucosaminyltransferase [Aridibaculum aurantiacum]|uniref:beta-1,6-N-acetylglucosaminyltransferase n=1 Tax=Aridibaculum aurantiacum TaxID=2810307 RepID=UPI001A97B0EF|nr:beta-1,6-N-acetylglucosaminyltransferase [Aridibaculum aurantiacum]
MQKAYIILAHKNGEQVYRLVERLNDDFSFFFLHIDKKASLEEFAPVVNAFTKKVKLVNRVPINWGGFGLVEATLNAMHDIKNHSINFNWISLLSGQDYPIKKNDFIHHFFKTATEAAFMDYSLLPDYNRWSPRGGYYRIDRYYLGLESHSKLTAKALNFLARFIPVVRRPSMKALCPYAGSQWWSMTKETMEYVLDYVENHPLYVPFHKYTFASDEVFFQTILLNAKHLKERVRNNNKRFFIWPDTSKAHPEVLVKENIDVIMSSEALFARKFDVEEDQDILDLIDQRCLDLKPAYQD